MRKPEFYAAVFGIIRDTDGKILFSRRYNTWHLDGYLSLPAWHVELWEMPTEAMIRELYEEIGIMASDPKAIYFQESIHSEDGTTYFNVFFEVWTYSGEIINQEVKKCSELSFRWFDSLENEKVVPYVRKCLEDLEKWIHFWEIRW